MPAEAQRVADLQAAAQTGVRHLGTRLDAEAVDPALLEAIPRSYAETCARKWL